ncbi:hypothetical protein GCM10010405_55060 [Streptomyces macrosporus]|uniref:Uncharacterized protein n=1 Tax=Streptomyces macrosporus TaxID=44032 RepID=A0ABN3KJM0_9ACTN
MEDLAGLPRGACDALGDDGDDGGEAGDVLQAGGGRGAGAEDVHALPGDRHEVGGGPGAGQHRLVPDVVVDDVAFAAAFAGFPADEALALEERDRLGDGRRADPQVPDEFGGGEAAGVGDAQAGQHPGRHPGHARGHEDGGERLLVLADGLGVASGGPRGRLRVPGRGPPAPVGAALAVHWAERNPDRTPGVVCVDGGIPYGLTGEEGRERIRKLFRRMRLLLPLVRPFGLAARMTADEHAEVNIEANEINAAIAPVLDRVTVPARYVLATGGNLGAGREEMEQVRAALDPVLARNPIIQVSAKVASNHSHILRKDFRAVADAVRGLAAVRDRKAD